MMFGEQIMDHNFDILKNVKYISQIIEYTSKSFSKVYKTFFGWAIILFFFLTIHILMRTIFQLPKLYDQFYNPHRIIGILLSVAALVAATLVFIQEKKSERLNENFLSKVIVEMWFAALCILIINDSTNYLPFAFTFEVAFVYEVIWQIIVATIVLFLLNLFTLYLTRENFFKLNAVAVIIMAPPFIFLSAWLFDHQRFWGLFFDGSLIMVVLNYFALALFLMKQHKSKKESQVTG